VRIAFLSTDFKPAPGGVAELGHQVCQELARRGHAVTVFVSRWDGEPEETALGPVTIRRIHDPMPAGGLSSRLWRIPRWQNATHQAFTRAIADFNPDLLFAGNYHFLWADILRASRRPYFVFLHGEDVSNTLRARNPLLRPRMKRVLTSAAWSFWNSRHSLQQTEALFHQKLPNASVVGCGVPLSALDTPHDRAAARDALGLTEEPVLITVCRLIFRKGVDTTLRALPTVLEACPDTRFYIVGDGPARETLTNLAAELGVSDHVTFTGFVDEHTRQQLYDAADVYVMPSRPGRNGQVEGFGISFLEANLSNLPAVGSHAGGIPDAVADGVNGRLVDPHDPAALAAVLIELLRDPEQRDRLAAAGRERIRTQFNWSTIVDQIEAKMNAVAAAPAAT
jgi:phosphatidylinositol alpha-1,6-mannosyltransferase